MKKYIAIIIIFISFGVTAQTQANIFDDTAEPAEQGTRTDTYSDVPEKEPEVAYSPGNPGEPVPIDDYLPLLVIIAAGLITYKTYGRKSLS
ncbi:hypothetical protein [Kaistella sp.]|uniref:hypothetical protein n=1 Tax=Kaistella sp. TaxID=2782235 RepID=UPI002F95985B